MSFEVSLSALTAWIFSVNPASFERCLPLQHLCATEEVLVVVYSRDSKLSYIKKETKHFTFVLKMNGPCDESAMIG